MNSPLDIRSLDEKFERALEEFLRNKEQKRNQTPVEQFEGLLKELTGHQTSGMVSFIDESLNSIFHHIKDHPELLPEGQDLGSFKRKIDGTILEIWLTV